MGFVGYGIRCGVVDCCCALFLFVVFGACCRIGVWVVSCLGLDGVYVILGYGLCL